MIKKTCIIFFILLRHAVSAQQVEVGAMLGFGNYFGDLANTPVLSETYPAGGVFARYNLSSSFALTGSINTTMVSGSDKNFSENQYRNLSFRSVIVEYGATIEFNYFKYGVGVLDKPYTSYIFAGISAFNFNPQTKYNGGWVDLNNIQTEGKKYGLLSVAIPFGIGFKWRISKHFSMEGNFGLRKTFTDYLDDVSGTYPNVLTQLEKKGYLAALLSDRSVELSGEPFTSKEGYRRGNSDFSDWYMIGGVCLSYRIYNRIKCARFY